MGMDLINLSNSSIVTVEPNQITFLIKTLIQAVAPAFIGGVVALLGYHFANQNMHKLEIQRNKFRDIKRRQEVFSQLMGRQRSKLQFYSAHFNAQINANYYDLLSIINAISCIDYDRILTHSKETIVSEINVAFIHERVNSNFYKEQQIEREKISNFMLPFAESSEQFFTTLGLIKVLFLNTQEMMDLIKQIETSLSKFSLLNVELDHEYNDYATSIMNSEIRSNAMRDAYVDNWTSGINSKKTKDLERYLAIYSDVNSKIDDLLNYLENEMKKEVLT